MSLLYKFVKNGGKIGLPLFFGRLEINGEENVPKNKPFLIAPNHQNAFLDAILMGVYIKKPVHFLTRSDVFVTPFEGVLSALNMMPVYRIRDGYEKLSKNEEVFAKCASLLKKGLPVLIFPEGNMDEGHYLRPLSKGTARLALQTQINMDEDLLILPVGINYFDHFRPRHKCIINFGAPIKVKDYLEKYNTHKAKGLIALRNDLSSAMKSQLLIPEKEGYETKVKALNRKNEKISFTELKNKIATDNFETYSSLRRLKAIPQVLTLFNPLAIGIVSYILSQKIDHRQFDASIKYTLGFFLSVLWWLLLFIILFYFFNPVTASVGTTISIILLFVRSDLKKITDPAS